MVSGPGETDPQSTGVRSRIATNEPVSEALDRLLDPLDSLSPSRDLIRNDAAADTFVRYAGVNRSRGPRDDVAAFFIRLRWSKRPLYRIPRLFLAWTALVAAVCGLVWITFTLGEIR